MGVIGKRGRSPKIKWTEKRIVEEITLLHYYDLRERIAFTMNNVFHKGFECDILEIKCTDSANLLIEYEVKITRKDFKSDSKKRNAEGIRKSVLLKDGKVVNRFYYIVPEDLIKADECPDYAGLIYVRDNGPDQMLSTHVVKEAPLLPYSEAVDKDLLHRLYLNGYRRYIERLRKEVVSQKEASHE